MNLKLNAIKKLSLGTLLSSAAWLTVVSCSTAPTPISRELGLVTTETSPPSPQTSLINQELKREPQSVVKYRYFDWPVDEARLTRGYSSDPVPHPKKRKNRSHWGIDLAAQKGTPIYSSHQGHVVYAGKDFKGYGKMVLLEGENGWATIYAHLDKITVKEGQKLRQGDLLGLMGKTGRVTGVHLHFEIRQHKEAYDPLLFLPNGEKVLEQLSAKNE
ncbi:MAG: M23 family metallopeptidase [Deltaproteobacteria bacterium]|jgi:murein DD-endopeptidase MepM/ murein hydrolase activator NlpD|nr:M23 family metallopeptidase [Deltaproteobacteria bacterium]